MKAKIILITLLFLFRFNADVNSQVQHSIEDSLQAAFLNANSDSLRLIALQDLLYLYQIEDIRGGEEIVDRIQLLIQKKDPKLSYYMLILRVRYTLDPDSIEEAKKLLTEFVNEAKNHNDGRGYADGILQLSFVELMAGNMDVRLQHLLHALNYARDTLHDNQMLSVAYHALGYFYYDQKDFPEAIIYLKKALETYSKPIDLAHCCNVVGMAYNDMGQYDSARVYYHLTIHYFKEAKMGQILYPITSLSELFRLTHEYDSALYYGRWSIEEAIRTNSQDISIMYYFVALTFREQNLPDSALKYFELAGEFIDKTQAKHMLPLFYNDIAAFYATQGNYKLAYDFQLKRSTFNDSLFNSDNNKVVKEMDAKFRTSEKEKEILNQNVRIQQQRMINLVSVISAAVLLLFMGIIFYYYVQKRKANKELMIAKERAEQSEKFKQQFLANMSHEIRTPMNAVMGMTNLLIDKNPRNDQQHYLDGIKNSSANLLHIINDILDISKIEAGKIELEQIDFSISEVVEQVKQTLHHKAEEGGIQLMADIDSKIPPVVVGDPVRLNQVLMNLTGNAIKFTEKGSVTIEVTQTETGIKFSIIDTGVGIPADKLQSVFESFTQAHSSDTRRFGGTGLGLTISRQLVELMGGQITVESEAGAGSIFSFEINYPTGSSERMLEQQSSEQIDGSILDGLKILLTDDNEYNRIVARDTLMSKANVEIIEAVNGEDALEKLRHKEFDIVLMDVQMPVMDGFEATRNIRKIFTDPKNQIPVIALTASVIRSDLDKCRQAGMNDYVPKPFKPSLLIMAIAKATGREIRFIETKSMKVVNKTEASQGITDLSYLEEFCEGDALRIKKYINIFLESALVLEKRLSEALKENNFEEIANQIHGFKTKWIMMGMDEAKELAVRIEQQCRKENPDHGWVNSQTLRLITLVQQASLELTNKIINV